MKPRRDLKRRKAEAVTFRDITERDGTMPVMRELAAAAAWRGFSLSEVARRINKRGYHLAASTVRRYLTAKSRPHQDTIDLLAEVIGLRKRHVALVSGERL